MSTRIKYVGKGSIEIRVGEHQVTADPNEIVTVEDARFAQELLTRPEEDFVLAPGEEEPGTLAIIHDDQRLDEPALSRMKKQDLLNLATVRGITDVTEDNNKNEIVQKILTSPVPVSLATFAGTEAAEIMENQNPEEVENNG